jgi:hypothetical protein
MAACGCPVALRAGDVGPLRRLLLGVCRRCARVLCPRWRGWCCSVLVVVSWRVVFSHRVSSCVWVPGYVAQEFEGPGEQVGGEGGTVGVPGGSPLVCSCSPVIMRHTSHPSFEGRRVVVAVLSLGCHLACWGAAQPRKVSRNEIEIY